VIPLIRRKKNNVDNYELNRDGRSVHRIEEMSWKYVITSMLKQDSHTYIITALVKQKLRIFYETPAKTVWVRKVQG
jgi:hypothetical protein